MDAFTKITHILKAADTRELLMYLGGFLLAVAVIMDLLLYIHNRRMSYYTTQLATLDKQRKEARNLLNDYKLVHQRRAEVEDIINQDKNFRIEPTYASVLQKLGLTQNQPEEPQTKSGDDIKDKTERILTSHITQMSMKQVTDLLAAIADIKQLYPKEITITKVPHARTVNIDLTIATLQPNTTAS